MKLTGLSAREIMELVDVAVCLPLVLIMNFSLFQYLVTTFYRRRHEPLIALLLFIAFLSFASLIPFGFPDVELIRDLNDISETCSVLTFVLQISILTRDINRKLKLKTLALMLFVAELLVLFGMGVLVCNFVDIVAPVLDMDVVEHLDDAVEGVSLLFIFIFRFYFLSMAKGYKTVWRTQKLEIFYYTLFLTHEYPFTLLNHLTGLSWEQVQGVWMRTTIVLCLWLTIKARISSRNSKFGGHTTTGMARGPSTFQDIPVEALPSGDSSAVKARSSPSQLGPGVISTLKIYSQRTASVVPLTSMNME